MPRTLVAVVGPTATGKSALAVALARRLEGEVVNADAMARYRGMDIGTAKIPPSQRDGIPHHQLDVLDVTEEASVAAYQQDARADVAAIRGRDRTPILAGGSGLYVRAVLDRLDIPPTDPELRHRLEADLARLGVDFMRERLTNVDPVAAERISPHNGRRIVRALEVVELTGKPFRAAMPVREYASPALAIGLGLDPTDLDRRIGERVEWMWRAGLLAEVAALLAAGLARGRTARTALGYAQAVAQLRGELTEAEAKEQTAAATRRFARRQLSWFRPDERIHWLPADAPDLLDRALALFGTGH
jgi:tRNA dimethylallyltransferase